MLTIYVLLNEKMQPRNICRKCTTHMDQLMHPPKMHDKCLYDDQIFVAGALHSSPVYIHLVQSSPPTPIPLSTTPYSTSRAPRDKDGLASLRNRSQVRSSTGS